MIKVVQKIPEAQNLHVTFCYLESQLGAGTAQQIDKENVQDMVWMVKN